MKTPRLNDFAQTPTRPIRELHSPLDDMPRIERPLRSPHRPDTAHHRGDIAGSPHRQAVAPPNRHIAVSPGGRIGSPRGVVVRRGFDYYEDQLAALKKLSLHEQIEGRDGSMSRMLRDALDDYLAKHPLDPDLT